MIKIFLAPTLEEALESVYEATVEAEYGDVTVEGRLYTLAHHGANAGKPCPCIDDNVYPLPKGSSILISHIDLDTLGGVRKLLPMKYKYDGQGTRLFAAEKNDFWIAVSQLDILGYHHLWRYPQEIITGINLFKSRTEKLARRFEKLTEVTELIEEYLQKITYEYFTPEEIKNAENWAAEQEGKSALVHESRAVRGFSTEMTTLSSAYYSPTFTTIAHATVVKNTKHNSITIAFEDGGRRHNAATIAKSLWGDQAGGRAGIAGSPRGWAITPGQLDAEFKAAVIAVEALYTHPL